MRFLCAAIGAIAALSFFSPIANAQQAANPVELFARDHRTGVASQPLVVLTVTQASPVSSLPSSCTDGQIAFATDGRTITEPAGAGTGVVVRCQGGQWLSLVDGSPVQK